MDEIALNGLTANWNLDSEIARKEMKDRFMHMRSYTTLKEIDEMFRTNDEFISQVRSEIFSDKIYVYTPKGDVVELPKGATCVDFAYRVHTEVGDKMVGAIVNDNIVPFDYELQTGDIIKVNTSKLSKGPNKDWLNFVITSHAKNKIKAFYSKREKDENICFFDTFEADIDSPSESYTVLSN